MRARSVWLAGILAAAALLGGCAEEETPSTLSEIPSSNEPLTEPSTNNYADSPDTVQEEVQRFYREYVQLRLAGFESRDALEASRAFFADSCDACLRGYRNAEQVLAAGQTVETEPVVTRSVTVDSVDGDMVAFTVTEDVPTARVVDGQGFVVTTYPATSGVQTLYQARRQPSGDLLILTADVLAP